jgi:hypothetical protein
MKALMFGGGEARRSGSRVRSARFEERSLLPAGAACVVAGGVRETLSSLLGSAVATRVLEPAIPSPQAWLAIARDALLYRARGCIADAAIVLRPTDAAAIAAAAFGEGPTPDQPARELSPLERDVIDRAVAAIAATLQPVAGTRERDSLERMATLSGFATYFEILLEPPLEARIGIALSRDPAGEPHGRLTLDDIAALTVVPRVSITLATIPAAAFVNLAPGTILPLARADALAGTLTLSGRPLARGTCGLREGRYALAIVS